MQGGAVRRRGNAVQDLDDAYESPWLCNILELLMPFIDILGVPPFPIARCFVSLHGPRLVLFILTNMFKWFYSGL